MGFYRVILLLLVGIQITPIAQASHVRATNLAVNVPVPESPLAALPYFGRNVVILRSARTTAPVYVRASAIGDHSPLRDIKWVDENSGQVLGTSPYLSGQWVYPSLYEPPSYCLFETYLDGEEPLQCSAGRYRISMSARDDGGHSATNTVDFEVITLQTALQELTAAAQTSLTNESSQTLLAPLHSAGLAASQGRFASVRSKLQRFQVLIRREYDAGRLSDDTWWPLAWSTGRVHAATRKK